jgi:hypothetical protein
VKSNLVASSDLLRQAGDFAYLVRRSDVAEQIEGIIYRCPGCSQSSTLFFGDDSTSTRHWQWKNQRDADGKKYPTLEPNVNCTLCGWEGRLRSGEWISIYDIAADANR